MDDFRAQVIRRVKLLHGLPLKAEITNDIFHTSLPVPKLVKSDTVTKFLGNIKKLGRLRKDRDFILEIECIEEIVGSQYLTNELLKEAYAEYVVYKAKCDKEQADI